MVVGVLAQTLVQPQHVARPDDQSLEVPVALHLGRKQRTAHRRQSRQTLQRHVTHRWGARLVHVEHQLHRGGFFDERAPRGRHLDRPDVFGGFVERGAHEIVRQAHEREGRGLLLQARLAGGVRLKGLQRLKRNLEDLQKGVVAKGHGDFSLRDETRAGGGLVHLGHELVQDLEPDVIVRGARLFQEVHDVLHDLRVRVGVIQPAGLDDARQQLDLRGGDEALQARRLVGEEVDDVVAHVHAKLRGLRRVVRQELRERRRREELRVGTRGAVEDSLVGSDREGDDSDGCARNC